VASSLFVLLFSIIIFQNQDLPGLRWIDWPGGWGGGFPQLPSAVTSPIDHSLGSPSLLYQTQTLKVTIKIR
jgi:hypothetical protein